MTFKKGQILLNKAKFHFFEKSQKKAKSYQYFRLCSILKEILSFFGTDLCEDIATMLSLVSFSALRLAEFPEILLSVKKLGYLCQRYKILTFLHVALWFNIPSQ
jgi:hypothetical protein